MKKPISLMLIFAVLIVTIYSFLFTAVSAAISTHVYMIVTNPGEDSNTQMCIGFHSDWDYTNCYIQYATVNGTRYTNVKKVTPVMDKESYTLFYGHATNDGDTPFNKKFIDWNAVITGLTPDTEYAYRICDGSDFSKVYRFKTAGADRFSIIWTSDMHVNSNYPERLSDWKGVVTYLAGKAKYPVGLHFNTGDTCDIGDRYNDWLSVAEANFTEKYITASVVGNHDVFNIGMLFDPSFTEYYKTSDYFKCIYAYPENGYVHQSQRLKEYLEKDGTDDPDGSKSIEDTNGKNYWFNYGGCLFIIFDYWSFDYDDKELEDAFNWASNVIKANEGKYDYLICCDHINLFYGGTGESKSYEDKYVDFLDYNNVDIFLAGDNHIWLRTGRLYNKQVTDDPSKGTYILQAPCISRPQNITCRTGKGYAVMRYSVAGYTLGGTVIDVTPDGMTFTVYAKENSVKVVDTFTVPKKVRYDTPSQHEDPLTLISPDYGAIENGMLTVVRAGTTCAELSAKFNLEVTVKTQKGEYADGDRAIATGWTVGTEKQRLIITVKGDINGDSEVDTVDAVSALRSDAGTVGLSEYQLKAADVNGDITIDTADAQTILKYDAGIIKSF